MTRRARSSSKRAWFISVTLLIGLTPSLGLAWQLLGAGASRPRLSERERVLQALASDPTALINVKSRDMPSSPDILNHGRRATAALQRCLSDNIEANIRASCAVMLEALADRRALPTLQAALEDWDSSVRYSVAEALSAIPDPSSIDPLLKIFRRKDEDRQIRAAALRALGAISHQRVVKALRAELARHDPDSGSHMRWQVFDALWANRHLMSERTLVSDTVAALRSEDDALVDSATYAAASLSSPKLVSALIPLMEHESAEIRNRSVYALGRIGDKKATAALLAKLPDVREARMLNNIAFALERLDRAAFYRTITQVVEHKQATIRLNAAFVLGDVGHAEGLPLLKRVLEDPSDYVRTSAVVAVGKIRGDEDVVREAIDALQPFVKDPNLSIRQEAIYAIHGLSGQSKADLIYTELYDEIDSDKHPGIVHRAALELGKAGDLRVRDYLTDCYIYGGCSDSGTAAYVRANATDRTKGRVLLAWARSNPRFTPTVAALKPAGTLAVASSVFDEDSGYWAATTPAALQILGGLHDPSVVPIIEPFAKSEWTFHRVQTLVALARLGDDAAVSTLMSELDNLPAEYLGRFVANVAIIDEPEIRAKFEPKLKTAQASTRTELALAAAAVSLRWDPDASIFRFREALASSSGHERDLGQWYLKRDRSARVTWLLRRMLAREGSASTRRRIRTLLDVR